MSQAYTQNIHHIFYPQLVLFLYQRNVLSNNIETHDNIIQLYKCISIQKTRPEFSIEFNYQRKFESWGWAVPSFLDVSNQKKMRSLLPSSVKQPEESLDTSLFYYSAFTGFYLWLYDMLPSHIGLKVIFQPWCAILLSFLAKL